MKRLSRRAFAALWLPLALNIASCLTRDGAGASSRMRATPLVASYGDDFEVYYHWGDAVFLDRLTNTHIPNHLFPGGERDYGYYSDELYAEIMKYSDREGNHRGPGLYVADNPTSSITYAYNKNPRLIEVIVDKGIIESGTVEILDQQTRPGWFLIKKNKGIYFREFSGAGLSAEELLQHREKIWHIYGSVKGYIPPEKSFDYVRYFFARVDAILKNPPPEKVRFLPPPEWVYGNDYRVYYHWGDADTLDRLTSTHIPNHIYPGEEKAYGYYSDDLYAEIMKASTVPQNSAGPGLHVALNPITSIDDVPYGKSPKLIEVIVDNRVVETETILRPRKDSRNDLRVIKKNKGIYFREFSGAGFSGAQLLDVKEMLLLWNGITPGAIPSDQKSAPIRYFSDRVDAIIKNPPRGKVRMLPPKKWVCPEG